MHRKSLVTFVVAAAIVLAVAPGSAQKAGQDAKDENNAYDVLYPKSLQAARAMAKDDTASIR